MVSSCIKYISNIFNNLALITNPEFVTESENPCIHFYYLLVFLVGFILLSACNQPEGTSSRTALAIHTPYEDGHFQVMVEVPVGSNIITSYNLDAQKIDTLIQDSLPLLLEYLPYPVNQGFIATIAADSSFQKTIVWILGRQIKPGQVIQSLPLAMMQYEDSGKEHIEFLMIPRSRDLRTVNVEKFRDLIIEYDPVKYNIEHWLRNRYEIGRISSFVWKDEAEAGEALMALINQSDPPPL